MIELDGIDDHEVGQIVLVRSIIAMPGNHIEWTVLLRSLKQMSLVLIDDRIIDSIDILEPGTWSQEVARVGKSIGSDRAQVWKLEVAIVYFQHVASRWAVHQDTEAHSLPFLQIYRTQSNYSWLIFYKLARANMKPQVGSVSSGCVRLAHNAEVIKMKPE